MYFRSYGFRKTFLDKCLKSHVSQDRSKNNMVNGPKHCSNLNHNTFAYLSINVKAIELEKVSLSNMQNVRTISEHTDCRSQVFSS